MARREHFDLHFLVWKVHSVDTWEKMQTREYDVDALRPAGGAFAP